MKIQMLVDVYRVVQLERVKAAAGAVSDPHRWRPHDQGE